MKIYKVFELDREVKQKLTQDNIDDILDAFIMYITDEYHSITGKFIHFKEYNEFMKILNNICSRHITVDEEAKKACYTYKVSDYGESHGALELIILLGADSQIDEKISTTFIKNMKLFKERLSKLGFKCSGHMTNNNLRNGSKIKYYKSFIYIPMFKTIPRPKK